MTSQSPEFTEITILTHSEAVEGLSDVLLCLGARGVVEEHLHGAVQVTAYLSADEKLQERVTAVRERLAALERHGLRVGPGTIGLRTLGAAAWDQAWKDHFEVLKIAPGLVIAPSWEDYKPSAGECVVILDPGAAFGTGGHATTRLCLRALVEQIRPGDWVADVGCGSGILAVTAALLGARQVVATDSDRRALPVARANALRNEVQDRIQLLEADLLPASYGPFDLILCNIVAEEVIRLAERLPTLLTHGGRFIASGFLTATVPRVEDALARSGLDLLQTISEENWAACIAVRPEQGR